MERRVETGRVRVRAIVEWLIAGAFILAMLAAASFVSRQIRTVSVPPVMAREAPAPVSPTPAGVPSRAVSVPVLLLSNGKGLRVGDAVSEVDRLLGSNADVAPPSLERGSNGERVTRFFERAGTRFVLVFESFARNAEARIAAIYRY